MYPQNTIYNVEDVVFRFSETPVIGQPYYFPPNDRINSNITRAIEIPLYNVDQMPRQQIGGGTIISVSRLKNTFITLVADKKNKEPDEFWKDYPLYPCIRASNGSRLIELRKRIDINKSYILFSDVTGITIDTVLVFYFHLEHPTN